MSEEPRKEVNPYQSPPLPAEPIQQKNVTFALQYGIASTTISVASALTGTVILGCSAYNLIHAKTNEELHKVALQGCSSLVVFCVAGITLYIASECFKKFWRER